MSIRPAFFLLPGRECSGRFDRYMDRGTGYAERQPIQNGKVSGDRFSFDVVRDFGGEERRPDLALRLAPAAQVRLHPGHPRPSASRLSSRSLARHRLGRGRLSRKVRAWAVALFNRREAPVKFVVNWADLKLEGRFRVRDVWNRKDLEQSTGSFEMEVPSVSP